jgi:hypothetical protein
MLIHDVYITSDVNPTTRECFMERTKCEDVDADILIDMRYATWINFLRKRHDSMDESPFSHEELCGIYFYTSPLMEELWRGSNECLGFSLARADRYCQNIQHIRELRRC